MRQEKTHCSEFHVFDRQVSWRTTRPTHSILYSYIFFSESNDNSADGRVRAGVRLIYVIIYRPHCSYVTSKRIHKYNVLNISDV